MNVKIAFKCDRCDKTFAFKSLYKIHVHTHLRSRIHKCFAGSCGREYKWPQDLHHHIQTHLKLTYGCNICDYSNSQKYLLKHHLKRHNDVMYYHCENVVMSVNGTLSLVFILKSALDKIA